MHALVLQAGQQSIHVLLTLRSNSENEKPPLFQTEKDLCKNVHQASAPLFAVPGWGTPGTRLDKVRWNKPSFASRQQAFHSLHSSPLAAVGASLVGTGGCSQAVRVLPCLLRKGFPGFMPL